MRNSNTRSKILKRKIKKSKKIFHAFSDVQWKYVESLEENDEVVEIRFNVKLVGFEFGDNYTSDFVCIKSDGQLMIRECVLRKNLLKPTTAKLLDASRNYWLARGNKDWGIVLDV